MEARALHGKVAILQKSTLNSTCQPVHVRQSLQIPSPFFQTSPVPVTHVTMNHLRIGVSLLHTTRRLLGIIYGWTGNLVDLHWSRSLNKKEPPCSVQIIQIKCCIEAVLGIYPPKLQLGVSLCEVVKICLACFIYWLTKFAILFQEI